MVVIRPPVVQHQATVAQVLIFHLLLVVTNQKVQQVVAQQLILHRVQLVLAHLIAQVANHHLHQVLLMKPIIIVVSTLI